MTEIGPLAIECPENPGGLHVLETEYMRRGDRPGDRRSRCRRATSGELVLTNLGRLGSPLSATAPATWSASIPGPARAAEPVSGWTAASSAGCDDMIIVRGNNVYPSALEGDPAPLRRRWPSTASRWIDTAAPAGAARSRSSRAPDAADRPGASASTRPSATSCCSGPRCGPSPPGSLPRFEMKARRFVRKTATDGTENARR